MAAQPPLALSVLAKAAHRAVVLLLSLARAGCRQKPLQSTKPAGQDTCLQVTLGAVVLDLPALRCAHTPCVVWPVAVCMTRCGAVSRRPVLEAWWRTV